MKLLRFKELLIIHCVLLSCVSSSAQISQLADSILINDSVISTGHIGISIYEPATNTYLYNYNATKYFVPASNTKLFTCYAGMKYLGDSLVGLRYDEQGGAVMITGTGDPTFLHPDFKKQPVYDFLKSKTNVSYTQDHFLTRFSSWGKGWNWDDYQEPYMAERSEFPIYGNCARFYIQGDTLTVTPSAFYSFAIKWENDCIRNNIGLDFKIVRPFEENSFHTLSVRTKFDSQNIPFKTITNPTLPETGSTFMKLLGDTLGIVLGTSMWTDSRGILPKIIHSQPTDSLLKPMMHRSDNFFAEQTLLMVSNEHLGYMNDEDIIDTLLKTDLKDVPQKPKWVDGCGLSRYNLFTPQSFVYILNKMKNEFGLKRLEVILPTGDEGSLKNYYLKDSGYIYAKTGSMSNIVCLSGFLVTQKNRLLIFSILANNFQSDGAPVRRSIEQFLESVRNKF